MEREWLHAGHARRRTGCARRRVHHLRVSGRRTADLRDAARLRRRAARERARHDVPASAEGRAESASVGRVRARRRRRVAGAVLQTAVRKTPGVALEHPECRFSNNRCMPEFSAATAFLVFVLSQSGQSTPPKVNLPPITVTAQKEPADPSTLPVSVTTVTSETIE